MVGQSANIALSPIHAVLKIKEHKNDNKRYRFCQSDIFFIEQVLGRRKNSLRNGLRYYLLF
jgi:hypothetical protein